MNFFGNAVATLSVATWEKGLDLDRAREVPAGRAGGPPVSVEAEDAPPAPARARDTSCAPARHDIGVHAAG